jgi:hypothetical protein
VCLCTAECWKGGESFEAHLGAVTLLSSPRFLFFKKKKNLFRAMAGSEERIKGSLVELELEERTPESWEMADLEENMKKLLAATQVSSSSSSSASMVSAVDCRGVGGEVVGVLDSVVGGHRGVEQVDSFLREALQNPRDRLTSKCVFFVMFFRHSRSSFEIVASRRESPVGSFLEKYWLVYSVMCVTFGWVLEDIFWSIVE